MNAELYFGSAETSFFFFCLDMCLFESLILIVDVECVAERRMLKAQLPSA